MTACNGGEGQLGRRFGTKQRKKSSLLEKENAQRQQHPSLTHFRAIQRIPWSSLDRRRRFDP
jgi:hypothetical protein